MTPITGKQPCTMNVSQANAPQKLHHYAHREAAAYRRDKILTRAFIARIEERDYAE